MTEQSNEPEQIKISTNEARVGETGNGLRYVLLISLVLAIIAGAMFLIVL